MVNANASWMSDLADVIGGKRLDQIVVPGTHDSGSASLDPDLGIAPDAPAFALDAQEAFERIEKIVDALPDHLAKEVLKKLGMWSWGHFANEVLIHGCLTQDETIAEQLEAGIRYFDIRLGPLDGVIRITHMMFGAPVTDVFAGILAFSDQHPKEILVLDFQHFNGMSSEQVADMADSLRSTFGARLVPRAVGSKVTPRELWAAGTPIIAVFSDYDAVPEQHAAHIWNREQDLRSEWADTDSIDVLMPKLTEFLAARDPDPASLFVTQGVLTSQTPSIGKPPALPDNPLHIRGYVKDLHEYIDGLITKLEHLEETYDIRKNAAIATLAVAEALTSQEWARFDKNIAMIDFFGLVSYLDIIKGLNTA